MIPLMMIPRWVYVLIGIVLVLFGVYRYGHHKGWYERDAEMQAVIAQKNEESRQKPPEIGTKRSANLTERLSDLLLKSPQTETKPSTSSTPASTHTTK